MIAYLAKRLLLAMLTLLAILFTSYMLLRLAPGDPTRSDMLSDGGSAGTMDSRNAPLHQNRSLREKLDLDKPLLEGFLRWIGKVLCHGDFGESATVDPGRPVTTVIGERVPVTLWLNIASLLLTVLLALPLGVCGAAKEGSCEDKIMEFLLFALYALPVMWVGMLLQSLFCEGGKWPLLPLRAALPENSGSWSIWRWQWELARTYFLPVLCLSYGGFAGLSRYARSSMLEILRCDYIRTARAKGAGEVSVLWEHGFRNALITMITLLGGMLPSLVAGSVLVEYIFNIPGMGTLSLLSLSSRDYPLQMALFAFTGALTLAGLLLCDLLYMAADPRIRLR